jgi:hypothetical protein
VAVVGERFTEEIFESQSESYFFVRCTNYHNHIGRIKNSSVITRVLPKTEDPTSVPSEEVEKFKLSFEISNAPDPSEGDIVLVRRGYLENLVGIVRYVDQDKCVVMFRLFTRRFDEPLPFNNLVVLGHINEILPQKGGQRNVYANKLRRGHDRHDAPETQAAQICTA